MQNINIKVKEKKSLNMLMKIIKFWESTFQRLIHEGFRLHR